MKLYKISQILSKLHLFSTNTIYLALRTLFVFLLSLSGALLILYLFPMLTDSPHTFLLIGKFRNDHCRTWNMARKLKITGNEIYTL